jgi:hypothetical protein
MTAMATIVLKYQLDRAEMVRALKARGIDLSEALLLDEDLCTELQNHLYLTHFPELVDEPRDALAHTRFYWLLLFTEKFKKKFGADAGLEQQVSKLLESADHLGLAVDWDVIERLRDDVLASGSATGEPPTTRRCDNGRKGCLG